MIAVDLAPPLSTYRLLEGDGGAGPVLAVFFILAILYGLRALASKASSTPTPRVPSDLVLGEPMIAISKLPAELQEPLKPFLSRGVTHLTSQQIQVIYNEAAAMMAGRARVYEQQAELTNAQNSYEVAVAAARFISGLNEEQRALLHMRIEAQVHLDFDRLRAENAQLASQVARYRQLSGPDRS